MRFRHLDLPAAARGACAAALAAICLCASSAAFGFGQNKIVYQRFEWKVYTSIHFEIFYYPEEEEFLDQMISNAESAYQKVSKALDYQPVQTGKSNKIPVIFYKTHGEFEQTNISLGEIDEAVGAFAEPFQGRIVIPIDGPPDKVYETLTHELTHIFEFSILYGDSLRRIIRSNPPLWLMEGLASYIGEDEDNIDRMVIRDAVVNNILPSVRQLNQLSFLTYRYGHAIFDFINQDWGPSGIRNFLWEYRKVLLTDNVPHAIHEAFGIDVEEFDRRFSRYLRKKYFPVLMEKFEPDDYGHDIGIKNPPGRFTFSPTLSPSGELVAALATPGDELDVVVLSAKDGKMVRNLTKGFTNKYDHIVAAAFEGKRDLSWSPEGDDVAFFVRRENFRDLWIKNALTGKLVLRMQMPVDIPTSPAFSPDGKKLLFAGNRAGIFDIFEMDLETKALRNLTDDNFYDANPTWSADGKLALYNRRIGVWAKIFLLDVANPERKTQLTFGESQDIMPVFGRDGKTVFFVSDRGQLGIFNVWSLDTESGELKRWTDLVGGAFAPVELASDKGPRRLAYASYFRGAFRLYEMDLAKPVETVAADATPGTVDPTPFQPPLQLTSDESEKKPYKLRWSIDAPDIAIGVADDGTVFSNSTVIFSDLLGDYRIRASLASVSSYSNIDVLFLNLKRRFQWGARVVDYRDYYVSTDINGNTDTKRFSRYTGASASGQYPFNRYYRVEGDLGYVQRRLEYPIVTFDRGLQFHEISDDYLTARLGFSGDTLRGKEFGPYHGKRFQFDVTRGFQLSGDTGSFTNYSTDFRAYGHLTRRSLLAWRIASIYSDGDGRTILPLGGYNELRGYDFRYFSGNAIAFTNVELRYPLIDELRLPFGSIRQIRGTIFFDAGAAWYKDGLWYDPKTGGYRGYTTTDSKGNLVVVPVKFNLWDNDANQFEDLRASWGVGLHFLLGGLEWHWDFAHRFPYMEYQCRGGLDPRTGLCPQPLDKVEVRDSSPRTTFWIGFSF